VTRRELIAILASVGAAFYIPLVVVGGPQYPIESWRAGALFVMVASMVGLTAHGLIARLRAVSAEREELLQRFRLLAVTDPLTDLANRRAWDGEIERTLAAVGARGGSVCVAVLDLDHFKRLNDAHGHQHGDSVLRGVADAWRAELRPRDVLARIGGEEFALLLECPLEDALAIVERVRRATANGVTCSAGVAAWDGAESGEALLARADMMLYRAKAAGRDRTLPEAPGAAPALRLLSNTG
jgi:diguanylate cyclase (GGDEF)-like protein